MAYDATTWLAIARLTGFNEYTTFRFMTNWQTLRLLSEIKFEPLAPHWVVLKGTTIGLSFRSPTVICRVEAIEVGIPNELPRCYHLPDVTWADFLPMSQACQQLLVCGSSPDIKSLKQWVVHPLMSVLWPRSVYSPNCFNNSLEQIKSLLNWITQQFLNWELGKEASIEYMLSLIHISEPTRH